MKRINTVIFCVVLLISGCATIGSRQNECERQHSSFEKIVACTKQAFANDPRANNDRIKLYFLKGDQLVEQINEGKITELDAKTEWQALYVQLRAQQRAERVRYTNCQAFGGNLNCTTY